MSKGTYNFTDGNNKGVKDKVPDWMDDLFEKGIQKKEVTIVNNLYENDIVKIKKCVKCGKLLSSNNTNKCPNCNNL